MSPWVQAAFIEADEELRRSLETTADRCGSTCVFGLKKLSNMLAFLSFSLSCHENLWDYVERREVRRWSMNTVVMYVSKIWTHKYRNCLTIGFGWEEQPDVILEWTVCFRIQFYCCNVVLSIYFGIFGTSSNLVFFLPSFSCFYWSQSEANFGSNFPWSWLFLDIFAPFFSVCCLYSYHHWQSE